MHAAVSSDTDTVMDVPGHSEELRNSVNDAIYGSAQEHDVVAMRWICGQVSITFSECRYTIELAH